MKAVVCYGNNIINYEEIIEPQIVNDNDVKINIKACGICGSDIPRAISNKAHNYPIVLGHEASGIVVAVGKNVQNVNLGDKVAIVPLLPCYKCPDCKNGNYSLCKQYSFIGSRKQGAMADYIVVPNKNVVKLSNDISFELGALFEPATVALHAIFQNKYNFNQEGNVAIIGGGTIGLLLLKWLKTLGIQKIIVFGRNKEHLQLAQKLGADKIISTLDNDFMDKVDCFTNTRRFDYVFETAGAIATIKYAIELAGNKANVCLVGTPTNEITFSVKEWERINRKELYLTGSWMSYSKDFPGKEWTMTREYFSKDDFKLLENLFYKKFHMKDANKAFSLLERNRKQVLGRLLLFN